MLSGIIPLALLAAPLLATPVQHEKRGNVLQDQFASESELNGMYTLYNNLWGEAAATSGSQTTQETSASGTTVAWKTTWNWSGGSSSVKSCEFLSARGV
jgi:xyloglucan-specific endo-beta-1,4-glucanase